jgi:hypothetical protein
MSKQLEISQSCYDIEGKYAALLETGETLLCYGYDADDNPTATTIMAALTFASWGLLCRASLLNTI